MLKYVLVTLAIGCTLLLLLTCGLGYYIYSWLQVEAIVVAQDADEKERLAAIERWLEEQFEQHKFNGGVLVVRDGEALLSKTCGFTDHTAKRELDEHSAFQLASVSKQFTAAAVLRLAETGRLTLDDPVAKHLDGFISDKVTIRNLLNHTGGVPDVYMDLAEKHRGELGKVLTTGDVVALVKKYAKMERTPGEAKEYSNTNYVLLAGIVEAVSDVSFEQFMEKELFEPLGMHDTRVWNLVSADRSDNQASDFEQINQDRSAVEVPWIDGVAGDGAVFSSLHDFVIWDKFWAGNSLVGDELLKQAITPATLNDGTESDYGFGWVVAGNRHWHNGSWLGARTFILRYPESRFCLVVLDNSSNPRLDAIVSELMKAVRPIRKKAE